MNTKFIITILLSLSFLLTGAIIYIVIKGNMSRPKNSPSPSATHKEDTGKTADEEKADSITFFANPEIASEGKMEDANPETELSIEIFYLEGRSGDVKKLKDMLVSWQPAVSISTNVNQIEGAPTETIIAVKKGFPGLKDALQKALPDEEFVFSEDYIIEESSADIIVILGR